MECQICGKTEHPYGGIECLERLIKDVDDLQKDFTRQALKLGRTEQELWVCIDALKALKNLCENSRWEDEVTTPTPKGAGF